MGLRMAESQCRDLRLEALAALNSERERLAARPQPAASPAAPAAPAAAPAAASGPSGATTPQGGSEPRKRPRGSAPSGKVWLDGGWVDRQQAKQARTPATGGAAKVRPMGNAPKGKTWDAVAGCWQVPRSAGHFKRKALEPAVHANRPARAHQRTRRR